MNNEIKADAAARDIMATVEKITKPIGELSPDIKADLARNIAATILDQFGTA